VPYATPIGLYADLKIITGGTFRDGSDLRTQRFVAMNYNQTREDLYSEIRAVDMSANNGDAGPRLPVLRDCEGEQGTLVPNGRMMVKRYYYAR
jgi:hypothetical protein